MRYYTITEANDGEGFMVLGLDGLDCARFATLQDASDWVDNANDLRAVRFVRKDGRPWGEVDANDWGCPVAWRYAGDLYPTQQEAEAERTRRETAYA